MPDSYTAFKNKIGLTLEDEYLSEKKGVVLSWPYKDCVLEGGMTKEDQKRDEIFWNETLAPDQISRLLDPKVFTNAKRIDAYAKDFADLSIEDQKRFLLECLDKNHLYVNYSEIDDKEYEVSEEDKKLNKEFYVGKSS